MSHLGKNVTIKKTIGDHPKGDKERAPASFTPSVIEPSFGIGRIISLPL